MVKNEIKTNFLKFLFLYIIKIINKRDLNRNIILQNQNELLTKKCCCYLGEESMKTVVCPGKIGLKSMLHQYKFCC